MFQGAHCLQLQLAYFEYFHLEWKLNFHSFFYTLLVLHFLHKYRYLKKSSSYCRPRNNNLKIQVIAITESEPKNSKGSFGLK